MWVEAEAMAEAFGWRPERGPAPWPRRGPGPLAPLMALSYVELIVEYNTAVYSGLKVAPRVARRGRGGAPTL